MAEPGPRRGPGPLGRALGRAVSSAIVRFPWSWRLFSGPVRRFCDSPEYLEPLVAAIDRLEASPGRILDIGTGTGPAALELAHFLKTVVLGHHLERLPESEREHFAAMVAAPLAHRGELVVDYVRLNNVAKREVAA